MSKSKLTAYLVSIYFDKSVFQLYVWLDPCRVKIIITKFKGFLSKWFVYVSLEETQCWPIINQIAVNYRKAILALRNEPGCNNNSLIHGITSNNKVFY